MCRRRAVRLHALLLTATVLGGWVGLPAADIFLYHRHPLAVEATGGRLAETGAPLPHALRCALEATCPRPRLAATSADLPAIVRLQDDPTPLRSPDRPRSRARSGIPQPRAPPLSGR